MLQVGSSSLLSPKEMKSSPPFWGGDRRGLSTIIQPNEYLVIWCDGKSSISQLHLPFKLKNADNSIVVLQSPDGKWKDSLCYNTHSSKETVGKYPDGGSHLLRFYHPTIGTHNMTTTYDSIVNTDLNASLSLSIPDEIETINYYTISGIRVLKPQRGIYIQGGALYERTKAKKQGLFKVR